MKIYSWNMAWHNKSPARAFEYIRDLDFDVLCLQEVPEAFLAHLKELPYSMVSSIDTVLLYSRIKTKTMYTAILSRYPILSSAEISFPPTAVPFRTRLFIWGMRFWGWTRKSYRGSLYADLDAGEMGKVRVFSLHLTLSGPSNRKKEMEIVESNFPDGFQAILCGDFNIVEHTFIKLISWILGSPFSESLPSYNERSFVDRVFGSLGLQNPLTGKITHPFSHSQLDHILVPATARISSAHVSAERFGSDHAPIFVELKELGQKH